MGWGGCKDPRRTDNQGEEEYGATCPIQLHLSSRLIPYWWTRSLPELEDWTTYDHRIWSISRMSHTRCSGIFRRLFEFNLNCFVLPFLISRGKSLEEILHDVDEAKQREGNMGDQRDTFARNKLRYDDKSICDGSLKAGHSNSTFLTVPAYKRSKYCARSTRDQYGQKTRNSNSEIS